jgi:predicted enzyme related to lactoylglutathione lyase
MPTRLQHLVVDAADPAAQARFWADALGWQITYTDPEEVVVEPPPPAPGLPLVFGAVPEPKTVKNRIHLDLASASAEQQSATVERLTRLGARAIDIGQVGVAWTVLADPEGNEFCVLEPREQYRDAGALAAVVVDAADPVKLAPFWVAASGWTVAERGDDYVSLRAPSGRGPWLEFLTAAEPKTVKDRLHLDVAPYPGDDHAAEVAALVELGATPADVGQGEVRWVVLADPQGGEFCVLTPR